MSPTDRTIDDNGAADPQPHSTATESSAPRLLENLQDLNFSHLLYFWTVARDGSIASACDRLQVSQPTISMQIRKLEKALGHRLFDRSGRNLVLTEVGRTVYEYADEMFSLGRELLGSLRGLPGRRSGKLYVGIPTFLPKLITYRLLEPVLKLPQDVQLICHEDDLNELVVGLARHKFDAILTDTPIHSASAIRCYNHPLGECDVAICAVPELAEKYREDWPKSIEGAPFLLPTIAMDLRRTMDRWFDTQPGNPKVIAEFDDSALMKEFGGGGKGLFPIPSVVFHEVREQYGIELVARLSTVRVKYYVVTTERKLKHPGIIATVQAAKAGVLRADNNIMGPPLKRA